MKITVNGRSTASSAPAPAPTKKAQPSTDPRTAKRAPRVSRQEAIRDVRRRVAPTVEEPGVNYEEPKAPAPMEDKIEEPTAQPKEKLEMKRRSRSKPVAGSDDSVLAVQHHRDREDVKRRRPAPKKIEADPLMDDDDDDDNGFNEIDRAEPLFSKPVVREKPSAEKHATKREKLTRPLKRMMNEKPTAKLTHASKPMGHMNPIAEEEVEEEPEELLEASIEESEEVPEMTKKRPERNPIEETDEVPKMPKKRPRRMAEEETDEVPKMPKKRPRRMAEEEPEEVPEMPKKRPRPSKRMAEEETEEAPEMPKKRSRKEAPEKPAKKSKPSKKPSKKARSAGEPVDLPNAKFNPIPLCVSLLITAIGAAGGYYGVQLLLKSVATIS